VHLLERPHPDLARRLLHARVGGANPQPEPGIRVGELVVDGVVCESRERAEDPGHAGRRAALLKQLVLDLEGVTSADLVKRPVAKLAALDLHLEDHA
jgi:hypothetical protein